MKFYERLSAVLVTTAGGILLSSVDWAARVAGDGTASVGVLGLICVMMGSIWFALSTIDNQ